MNRQYFRRLEGVPRVVPDVVGVELSHDDSGCGDNDVTAMVPQRRTALRLAAATIAVPGRATDIQVGLLVLARVSGVFGLGAGGFGFRRGVGGGG